jgi:hypothetical protein
VGLDQGPLSLMSTIEELSGSEWTASHARHLTPRKENWYPLDRRLVSPRTNLDAM